jgi:hypothetical protein
MAMGGLAFIVENSCAQKHGTEPRICTYDVIGAPEVRVASWTSCSVSTSLATNPPWLAPVVRAHAKYTSLLESSASEDPRPPGNEGDVDAVTVHGEVALANKAVDYGQEPVGLHLA